jgi:hypothetical protein
MSQGANISVQVTVDQSIAGDLSTAKNSIKLGKIQSLVDGAGLGQANLAWSDKRTLAGAAADSLDLAGSLTDAFGQVITFTKIKAIAIVAAAANTDAIVVGGGSNAFSTIFGDASDELIVRPGGMFILVAPDAAGYAVTPATGDLLAITNSAAAIAADYEIVLIGA